MITEQARCVCANCGWEGLEYPLSTCPKCYVGNLYLASDGAASESEGGGSNA